MVWQFLAGILLAVVLTYALRPKPYSTPPAGLDELQVPTAEEGSEIPVLFGCRDIRGANVVWYGDLKTKRIKSSGGKK